MTQDRTRHTKEKEEPRFICPFPDCVKTFWKEPGKPDACGPHRQLIADVVFIIEHLKTGPKPVGDTGPVLLVPKPGMTDQAIQEAKEIEQRGKKKP